MNDYQKINKAHALAKKAHPTPPAVCEDCGKPGHLERHHDDYDKPEEIRWLHRKGCHPRADEERRRRLGVVVCKHPRPARKMRLVVTLTADELRDVRAAAALKERTVPDWTRLLILPAAEKACRRAEAKDRKSLAKHGDEEAGK